MKAVLSSERSMVTMKSSRGLPSAFADGRFRTRSSQSGTVRTCSSPFSSQRKSALESKHGAELLGVAFVEAVEIILHHRFDSAIGHGAHWLGPPVHELRALN